MNVVTRFAPSPTGHLHIGGARTALFNWLYAKHMGGLFRLRIEDTDRKRSSPEAIDAILEGLAWLGLQWSGEPVYQYSRSGRHADIARKLLENGEAYYCYCSPEELAEMRKKAKEEKRPIRYDGTWRDRSPEEAPADRSPVVRFRAPLEGTTVIEDHVQGTVEVRNTQLDDMVLLRADGSPTYMLSVVVDDHDMEITHVIRGDDHLTNAFRQTQLYRALDWQPPRFAHVPLIHGPDGTPLSKRHGALGVEAYRNMGVLPEALVNYLCRLGWSHGDDEIFTMDQAMKWFDIADINRGPARMDPDRLKNLNGHYLANMDDSDLVDRIAPALETRLGRPLEQTALTRLEQGMSSLKTRAKTLVELAEIAVFYAAPRPLVLSAKAARQLQGAGRDNLIRLRAHLDDINPWTEAGLETSIRDFARDHEVKLGRIAQPLRAALTGTDVSPGIFEVAAVLGKEETLGRLDDAVGAGQSDGDPAHRAFDS